MRERLHLRKTLNERKGYEKMIRNNRIKKVIVLLMVAVLALSFAACGGNKGGSMDKNPKNAKKNRTVCTLMPLSPSRSTSGNWRWASEMVSPSLLTSDKLFTPL